MSRQFFYTFDIVCGGPGNADMEAVENLINLSMQDLVYDQHFQVALDEKISISIRVIPASGL